MAREKILWIAVIALAAFLIFFAFRVFQQSEEIKGLKESRDMINEFLENEKDKNFRLIDSLNNSSQSELIEEQSRKIDSLIAKFNNRPKTPRYDTNIDKMRDSDSISDLFNRFYPNSNN